MTEHVILQYIGFVMTHMKIIESGKHASTPREGKLFYHVSVHSYTCTQYVVIFGKVFHKLLSLELFTQNKPPLVYCTGDQKEFIMRIRKGPLEVRLISYFVIYMYYVIYLGGLYQGKVACFSTPAIGISKKALVGQTSETKRTRRLQISAVMVA